MSINITVPENTETPELKPRICVIGVGGAGGNAVSNMIAANLEGCDFIVANTDAQSLKLSKAERRIQLGNHVTKGLGAGSKPEVGRAAAEESIEAIINELGDANMVFIAAGMGGGTGTGAAPIIAQAARENGILTVGVVTKPFQFEGSHRMRLAEAGLEELSQYVDTLIIIPNQNLFRVANEKTTFADAFKMADDVLYSGVRSITDLMVMPGLINLDFADVQSVMAGMGRAMMGTGEAAGERRALDAAEAAISNPLLDDASMRGARGVLINITGGDDITLFEVDEAANRVRAEVDEDAYIIIGSAFDTSMEGTMRVSVVATGLEAAEGQLPLHLDILSTARRIEPVRVPRPAEEPVAEIAMPEVAEAEPEEIDITGSAAAEMPDMSDAAAMEAEDDGDMIAGSAMEDDPLAAEPEPAPLPARPAALPGANNVGRFIPPQAVEVEDDDVMYGPAPGANPFEVAAMVNGSTDADADLPAKGPGLLQRFREDKGLSLFERVTGTGRVKSPEKAAPAPVQALTPAPTPAPAPQPAPAARTEQGGTIDALIRSRTAKPAPEMAQPAPQAKPSPVQTLKPAQPVAHPVRAESAESLAKPKLGGIDSAERPQTAASEDDLLNIPAFLRRQAN
ncbi:MAG: cell division protein FtsZ [Rhodospirillaceae bacterium]